MDIETNELYSKKQCHKAESPLLWVTTLMWNYTEFGATQILLRAVLTPMCRDILCRRLYWFFAFDMHLFCPVISFSMSLSCVGVTEWECWTTDCVCARTQRNIQEESQKRGCHRNSTQLKHQFQVQVRRQDFLNSEMCFCSHISTQPTSHHLFF